MSATVGIRTRVASLEGLNPNQLDYGCNKRMYLSGLYNVYENVSADKSQSAVEPCRSPVLEMHSYVLLFHPNCIHPITSAYRGRIHPIETVFQFKIPYLALLFFHNYMLFFNNDSLKNSMKKI